MTTTPYPDTTLPAAEAAGPHQPAGDRIEVWTEDKVRALGVVTDLPTAARIFGLGRALAYQLAAEDTFPVPLLRVGNRYRVPVAAILTALHIPAAIVPEGDLTTSGQSSVDHHDAIRSSGPQRDGAAPT
ncbi:DNA-binding protein [Dactylosporangium sp. NPDC051485]|uniref:DNA-binding protein n=1 Tax=Dactylosporangium sp. NPDC051485 TaxID=3154846 RepID=UPI0034474916